MIDRIRRYISEKNLFLPGDRVLVSLSGGPDSVALLLMLEELKKELGIELFAFHLNHMLRGDESLADEQFCKSLCARLGIEIFIINEDIAKTASEGKLSTELAGRKRRYFYLEKLCAEKGIDKIATAHNRDDSAESIMLNMIRGTGLRGLSGIKASVGRIVRPLLFLGKQEIRAWLDSIGAGYCTDSSNADGKYARNYLRNTIFPDINRRYGIDFSAQLWRMSGNLSEDSEYIEQTAKELYDSWVKMSEGEVKLELKPIATAHPALAKRAIRLAYEAVKGDSFDFEDTHARAALALFSLQSGSRVDLPGGVTAAREFDNVCFFRRKAVHGWEPVSVNGEGCYEAGAYIFRIYINEEKDFVNNMFKKDANTVCFEYDKIDFLKLVLRRRAEHDVFSPMGRGVTKKLKKFFIEQKVPVDIRDEMPLLAQGSEILWIPGIGISEKHAAGEGCVKRLCCEYIRRNEEYGND